MSDLISSPRVRAPRLAVVPWTLLAAAWIALAASAAGQENLGNRNYYIRIGVARQVTRLGIKPLGSYEVSSPAGLALGKLAAGGIYTVEIIKGHKTGNVYRLVVRELDGHQEDNARVLAKAAGEAYGLPSKAIRMPARESSGEDERLLVTVGEFDSMAEAKAYQGKLKSDTIRFIFEEKTIASEGRIIIRDAAGAFVASDPSLLRLNPETQSRSSIYVVVPDKNGKPKMSDFDKKANHYRGLIDLAIDEQGTLTAVNNLWLEYYVYGVVASEMGPTVPLEALKAQAVVARSTAVARIERGIVNENPLFDFVDTQMDQAYDGKGSDSDIVRRAVDLTRGEILVWDGKAVEAVYSHSCGGVISSAADMWDSTQLRYFQRKADTLQDSVIPSLATSSMADHYIKEYHEGFCNPNQLGFPEFAKKNYHWSKTLSADAFNKSLDKAYGTGKIKDIAVERRSASGRVRVLRIAGEKRTVRLDREMVIRSALGGLKSTFFVIEPEYDSSKKLSKITIYGAGYGHGVGMCQIGAIMMSKQNFTYRQILGHYFMNVKIRKLYS